MLMTTGEEGGGEEDGLEEEEEEDRSAALLSAGKAALLVENVPTASMSSTVLKPLAESASAAARKLPAAQFTRTSSAPPSAEAEGPAAVVVATETHRSTSSGFLTSPWIPCACATPQERRSATAASRTAWRRPVTKTEAPWRPERGERVLLRLRLEEFQWHGILFLLISLSFRTKLPRDLEADARRASRDENGLFFGKEFRERERERERASR